MQNSAPDIHILGHWSYPAKTKKTVNVVSNCESVELTLNGKLISRNDHPTDGFIFGFPDVTFEPGILKAVGRNKSGQTCEYQLTTAGPPAAIKLTPITGPGGFLANAEDVTLFDVEVVDQKGQRCPCDEGRIDFAVTGPAIWRGGYNSGVVGSTNNLYLSTECGINRVSVRSTLTAGKISLTATRQGLKSAKVEVESISGSSAGDLLVPAAPRRGLPSPSME